MKNVNVLIEHWNARPQQKIEDWNEFFDDPTSGTWTATLVVILSRAMPEIIRANLLQTGSTPAVTTLSPADSPSNVLAETKAPEPEPSSHTRTEPPKKAGTGARTGHRRGTSGRRAAAPAKPPATTFPKGAVETISPLTPPVVPRATPPPIATSGQV